MKHILKRKEGYALIWVLIVFTVTVIISSIIVTASMNASITTKNRYNSQQAYYTAKAAANSVADYIIENINDETIMNNLTASRGTGSIENMGDYTVDVTYVNSSKIKVTAKAVYRGETASVSVSLIKSTPPTGIIPTDNVIYLNGSGLTGFGQLKITGNVYINGDLNLSQGSSINGNLVVNGNTTIAGGAASMGGLFSFGNVLFNNGAIINGDVKTKGNLSFDGGPIVHGSAYADGSLYMPQGTIKNDAYIGNDVSFGGGSNKINGTLYYGGSISTFWGNASDFAPQREKVTNYTPIDESPYLTQVLPIIKPPTSAEMPETNLEIRLINTRTINRSGRITGNTVTDISKFGWKNVLTIDASNNDIYLLVENTALNLSNGNSIEVISDGTHNVYMYLTGSSSITINANIYVGMKTRGANPHLFIFGDGEQKVALYNNSELNACVYMPKGEFEASGSSLEGGQTYKFVGVCIVKKVKIDSNVSLHYSKPNLEDSPLEVFTDIGGSTGANSAWGIESWG